MTDFMISAAPAPAAAAPEAWSPLASSPMALNYLARALGVSSKYEFTDVLGLDDDLLPASALAFVVTFPTSAGEAALGGTPLEDASLVFLRQRAGGQCGFLAAAHALANSPASAPTLLSYLWRGGDEKKPFARLVEERSLRLVESTFLKAAHERCAGTADGPAAAAGVRQGRHFVTFVPRNGGLVLLDGRRETPIALDFAGEAFPQAVAAAVMLLIAAAGADAYSFSVLALVEN